MAARKLHVRMRKYGINWLSSSGKRLRLHYLYWTTIEIKLLLVNSHGCMPRAILWRCWGFSANVIKIWTPTASIHTHARPPKVNLWKWVTKPETSVFCCLILRKIRWAKTVRTVRSDRRMYEWPLTHNNTSGDGVIPIDSNFLWEMILLQ